MQFRTHQVLAMVLAGMFASACMAMDRGAYQSAEKSIEARVKAEQAHCERWSGDAKDVCQKDAQGREKIAKAELEAYRQPSASTDFKVREAYAETNLEVSKKSCDGLHDRARKICVEDAQAEHSRAMGHAKIAQEAQRYDNKPGERRAKVAEARREAAKDRRQAEFKAVEARCEWLHDHAKEHCIADAKRAFGQ